MLSREVLGQYPTTPLTLPLVLAERRGEADPLLWYTMQCCLNPWAPTTQLCGIWRYWFESRNFVSVFA